MPDPSLGKVHFIPAPKKYSCSKRATRYLIGQTYLGRRVQTAVYGGMRKYLDASLPKKPKISMGSKMAVAPSTHSSSVMGTPNASRIVEFNPIEEDEGADGYEDIEWSPASLLGTGYSALLENAPNEVNHHQKWRRIMADQWMSLLPSLVMPYLRWCQITCYGRTKPPLEPPHPSCICGQNEQGTMVQMVDSESKHTSRICKK